MENPPQIVQQILFALDRLGDSNGHHEYEKICFAFGRRRISMNLLPATGPVSAGGDQGRDSESFWSNLPNELAGTSAHLALVSSQRVVVACTIQKTGLPTKIRSDLRSITGQGTSVARVIYFTVASVPVATRHELINEAQDAHGIELEIFDGPGLAEQLADPDLYWIAAEYLRLPSSLAPQRPANEAPLPAWYLRDRDYWRARSEPGRTMGDLVSLRDILRHATFHEEAMGDIGDWIATLREFLTEDGSPDVQMRAKYEIAVATLRGTGTLHAADPLMRDFFEKIKDSNDDLSLLEDAVVLLQYGYGARLRGHTDILMEDLDAWYETLRGQISTALAASPYPNAEAALLAIDARLAFFPAYPDNTPERIEGLVAPKESMRQVLDAYENDEPVPSPSGPIPLRNLNGGMLALKALVRRLPSAPVFPIEHTAELFEMLTLSVADHPLYTEIRDGLDQAVGRIDGDAAKAERAHARAMKFLESNQLIRALAEVHEAKIGWRHGETLEESIPMMLLAASIYEQLGLFFAAKLHAYAAAVAARSAQQTDLRRYIPQAIAVAAINDSKAGNWCSSSRLLRVAFMAQNAYAEDPTNLDRHGYLADALQCEMFAFLIARDFALEYEPTLRATAQELGTEQLLDDLAPQVAEEDGWTVEAVIAGLDRQGRGRPFSDAGHTRAQRWSAFGADWTVRCANTRRDVLAAERLISAIQVIQVELAYTDPVWLPAKVDVEVKIDGVPEGQGESCERLPDNEASRWIVHLVPAEHLIEEQLLPDVVSAASSIFIENSLLDLPQFMELVHGAFSRGLGHKLSGGRPYDEAANFLSDDDYLGFAQLPLGIAGAGTAFEPTTVHPELIGRTDLSKWYDRDEALASIQRRYDRMMPIGRLTIPRLAADPVAGRVLRELREEGWLDWHLMMAITNILGNARPGWEGFRLYQDSPIADRERAAILMRREELDTDPPLPIEAFTRERLLQALEFTGLLTVPSYGLHVNASTPNVKAILEVLRRRFNFDRDDVDHSPFLT